MVRPRVMRPLWITNRPHLKLRLRVYPKQKRLEGVATLTATPIARALKRLTLHAAELQIKGITVDGRSAKWRTTKDKLTVLLPQPAPIGKPLVIAVSYKASPRAGLYFVLPDKHYPKKPVGVYSQGESELNRFWFPSWDYPNARFTSEMIVTVPKPLMAISNGKLLKKSSSGPLTTFHYRMPQNHVNYLISLVIGEYALYRLEWDGIPILSYVPPKDKALAPRSFKNTPDMMAFYSKKLGFRYPYPMYTQVTVFDFMWGGMENITASTLSHGTLHDKRAHLDERSDNLVAHELVHQWFGDLLTCKDWSHIWLNESFATYFDLLYQEHKWGQKEFHYNRRRYLGWYFGQSHSYQRAIQTRVYETAADMFDSHSYPKGAAVLHMIRTDLGDTLWWRAIQTYVKRYANKVVETSDFRKVLEEVSGRNWERFFDQWIRRPGHPTLTFKWAYNDDHRTISAQIRQTQKGRPYRFTTIMVVTDARGTRRTLSVEVSRRHQTVVLPSKDAPLMVEFDPREDILKTIEIRKSPSELIAQLKRGSHVMSRIRAAKALGHFPNRSDVRAALSKVLLDQTEFYGLRRNAARALGTIATRRSCTILLAALAVKESKVRSRVARRLGYCKVVNPFDALLKLLNNDQSYEVREHAVWAIARLRHKRTFKTLVSALKQEEWQGKIKAAALGGLRRLETPKALPHLRKHMAPGGPRRPRQRAIMEYARLVYQLKLHKKAEHRLALERHLDDSNERIVKTTIKALGLLGNYDAVPRLRRLASQSPLATFKKYVRRAIQTIHTRASKKDRTLKLGRSLEDLRRKQRKLREKLELLEQTRRERH